MKCMYHRLSGSHLLGSGRTYSVVWLTDRRPPRSKLSRVSWLGVLFEGVERFVSRAILRQAPNADGEGETVDGASAV